MQNPNWHMPQPPPQPVPVGAIAPVQVPEAQVSLIVQGLPSSHEPPVCGEPLHSPLEHMSFIVHSSKSSHCWPRAAGTEPTPTQSRDTRKTRPAFVQRVLGFIFIAYAVAMPWSSQIR